MRKKSLIAILLVLMIINITSVCYAQDMTRKLGRGVGNILTGWIEVPKNIAVNWEKTDPFTGLVVGSIKGIGWSWTRTVSGIYDVFTFPFPVPENYRPLMEPEFVLPSIWGAPLPVSERLAR